jgi:hypothetical protein
VTARNFATTNHRTTVEFNGKLNNAEDPEAVLLNCLQGIITEAVNNCNTEIGAIPDKMYVQIFAPQLQPELYTMIQRFTNAADAALQIHHEFVRYNRVYEEQRGDLMGEPFTVKVTSICTQVIRENEREGRINDTVSGSAPLRKKTAATATHAFYNNGILEINNQDTHCLFYAAEMARLKTVMNADQYRRLCANPRKQKDQALWLMNKIRAPHNMANYDAKMWLPKIQAFYDLEWPTIYKIFVFDRFKMFSPTLKTGDLYNRHPLSLLHDGQHFNVIYSVPLMFGKKNNSYCFACESTYL